MKNAREKLQAVIDAHQQAVEDVRKTGETLGRAQAFLADLVGNVAEFKTLDDDIAASRAAEIDRAMAAGETPTLEARPELISAAAKKVDAENKLSGARSAVAAIEKKLADLNKLVIRLDLEKEWAAEAVLGAEAQDAATAFLANLAAMRREFYRLLAVRGQWVRLDPETKPAPSYPGQHVPTGRLAEISEDVKAALDEFGILGRHEERNGLGERDRIANAVAYQFKQLQIDASATIEDALL